MDSEHRQDADATWHWLPANDPNKSERWYESLRWALRLILAVVACEQASKRQILIEIGPMQAEGRHLDIVQLIRRPLGQPRVPTDRKTHFQPAVHRDHSVTISEGRCFRRINQGAHARLR